MASRTAIGEGIRFRRHRDYTGLFGNGSRGIESIPFRNWAIEQKAWLSPGDRATRACQLKSCNLLHKYRRLAFQKLWKWWMTFKVIQGHSRLCHLIGHIWFPISHPLEVYLVRFSRYQHLFAKILIGHVTLTTPTWRTICYVKANTSLGQPMHKIWSLYLQPFQRYFRGCKMIELLVT